MRINQIYYNIKVIKLNIIQKHTSLLLMRHLLISYNDFKMSLCCSKRLGILFLLLASGKLLLEVLVSFFSSPLITNFTKESS